MKNQWFSKIAVWMVIAMVLFTVFKQFDGGRMASANQMAYSDFLEEVRSNRVKQATIPDGLGGCRFHLREIGSRSGVAPTAPDS